MSNIVATIRNELPRIISAQTDRIRNQFAELQLQLDPQRLEQEIVLITQKADIHEEVDRLDTHERSTAYLEPERCGWPPARLPDAGVQP